MTFAYPENFARFYDVIYHQQRDSSDQEFYLNEALKSRGRVLETGAGTGRLFINALQSGADIYGLDISPSMIDRLSKKLDKGDSGRISLQNIIDFNYSYNFDLILAPFRVMMHLTEKAEQLKAINNVYRHLNSGGRFIFDVFIPDFNYLIHGIDNFVDFDGEYEPGKRLRRTVSNHPDTVNQVIHITFLLDWDEDGHKKHDEWELDLRYFFRFELEHLIELSEFDQYKILGDFNGGNLSPDSKEYVVICEKYK